MAHRLEALFDPKGIAVVGASTHPGKFGFVSLHNILANGYQGGVFAINPQGPEILGLKSISSVEQLPANQVELLFICTPAEHNLEIIRQGVKRGARAVFVASAGYAEVSEDGRRAQAELASLCDSLGVCLAGPNGQGLVSTPSSLCAQIVGPYPPPGPIAITSQSGNFVSSFMNYARSTGVGVSRAVSAGNSASLKVIDYLEYFAHDPHSKVALAYLESVDEGRDLFERLSAITTVLPTVVLKGGRTEGGQRAAASHTGALASNDRIFDGMIAQAGAIRAASVEQAFDFAATLATQPLPKSNRVAILTSVGGWGVLTADSLAGTSLQLAQLSTDTHRLLDALLSTRWSRSNPIDMAGAETRDTIPNVLEVLANAPEVDAIVHLGVGIQSNQAEMMISGPFLESANLERITNFHLSQDARYSSVAAQLSTETSKPILTATELATTRPDNPGVKAVTTAGRLCYSSGQRAIASLDAALRYRRFVDH